MLNAIDAAVTAETTTLAAETTETATAVAVAEPVTEAVATEATPAETGGPEPEDPMVALAAMTLGHLPVAYTRAELLNAREFVLLMKRTHKQGGFGEHMGRFIRDTVGYKFDAMNVMDVLRLMAHADFMEKYRATVERWLAGVKHDGSDTGKANAAKHKAAMNLVADPAAYARLVKSLLILCQRNQSWVETGTEIALPYNGHKAMLDLFSVNVTNSRRMKLAAS